MELSAIGVHLASKARVPSSDCRARLFKHMSEPSTEKTKGTAMAEEMRQEANKMTEEQRAAALAQAMRLIFGETEQKPEAMSKNGSNARNTFSPRSRQLSADAGSLGLR
jgi:hypothetical protein